MPQKFFLSTEYTTLASTNRVWISRLIAICKHPYLLITIVVFICSLVFYLPFLVDGTMDVIYRYWDGPNYVYLAKALYAIPKDHPLSPYTTPEYFAAHLPLYPLTIRLFSFMGYNNAMLFSTFLYTVLATVTLYQLLKENRWVQSPMWSAVISLFIPARYLIYHNVGATEAPFVFFTLASILSYLRGNYLLAFVLGGLSGITRITGVLIGVAYFFTLIIEKKWKYIPLLAIVGIPLFATFTFYYFHYGDFFAYFGVNLSSSNSLIHLKPFDIFLLYSKTGNTHSAEFYLMMYAIYGIGVCLLWQKNKLIFLYSAVSYIFCLFIFHQDLARYLIPLAPFALIIGYDRILSQLPARVACIALIPLCYYYAWKILPHNLVVEWVYKNLIRILAQ